MKSKPKDNLRTKEESQSVISSCKRKDINDFDIFPLAFDFFPFDVDFFPLVEIIEAEN